MQGEHPGERAVAEGSVAERAVDESSVGDHSVAESSVAERLNAIEEMLASLLERSAGGQSGLDAPWLLSGVDAEIDEAAGGVAYGGRARLPDGREAVWQMAHPSSELLGMEWADLEDALRALGHRHRLELLQQLLLRPQTALQLAESGRHGTTGQIYNHLRQLVGAGWLSTAVRGVYGVPTQRVIPLLVILAAARPHH